MNPPLNVIADKIRQAEKIVVGASNGLSIAEGIHIFADNADFHAHFGDFSQTYGFRSMIHGCFYPFPNQESYWAYFARLCHYMNVQKPAGKVMADLRNILKNKDYFVITSNFDNHFRQAGFAEERLFEIEGVGKKLQCCQACHDHVYDGTAQLEAMYQAEQNGEIPSRLIPRCPDCGGEMKIHIELDRSFQRDTVWREKQAAYHAFLHEAQSKNTLFLELGVGTHNQLIKLPFMQQVYARDNAFYITVNKGEIYIPPEIAARSLGVASGLTEWLEQLHAECAGNLYA